MPTRVVNVRGRTEAELEAIPGFVYVGRKMPRDKRRAIRTGSPFGNPFRGPGSVARYIDHVLVSPELLALLPTLAGRALGCWCIDDQPTPPAAGGELVCHAQALALLADGWRPVGPVRT
jgi:hypothetical protein